MHPLDKWKMVETSKPLCFVTDAFFSPQFCRMFHDMFFVFGDNEARTGTGGQAVIRFEKNSIGVRTKKSPCIELHCYWSDSNFEGNCKMIDEDIEKINKIRNIGIPVVFSSKGYGTGFAELHIRSPKTLEYIRHRFMEEFGLKF